MKRAALLTSKTSNHFLEHVGYSMQSVCLVGKPAMKYGNDTYQAMCSLSQWTLKKKGLNFIFPTNFVIPKSLKFSHWPSKCGTIFTNQRVGERHGSAS